MIDLPDVLRDPRRLDAVDASGVFSPTRRASLDAAAREAAVQAGVPVGLVSIVTASAQLFAGRYGLDGWLDEVGGTPVEWSFCQFVVGSQQPLVVPDTHAVPVFANNPLVREDGVRAYAGVPITLSGDRTLGSLCVIHDEPHAFSEPDIARLRARADALAAELEAAIATAEPSGR